MLATLPLLRNTDFPTLKRRPLEVLQVNLGYLCNQQCLHCHVNAGPNRTESMNRETCDSVLTFLQNSSVTTLDLTGGAPELNPHFRYLVNTARQMGIHVIDRCNLTVLTLAEHADLATFLATHQVEVVASLPCYLEDNVDKQRGSGVFHKSIMGLHQLNAVGYGQPDSGLTLNLVYNPLGPVLPPPQSLLAADYKKILKDKYNIVFNQMYTICNMPIQRFGSQLISKGQFNDYMNLLRQAHSDANLEQVMCRHLISVDWQGYVYDCDFNQLLDLPLLLNSSKRWHIAELHHVNLTDNDIMVADHCYGCTAGQGSSCGGALS